MKISIECQLQSEVESKGRERKSGAALTYVMLRDAAWCCVVLRGAAWCCVVLRGAAWCCVVLRDAV